MQMFSIQFREIFKNAFFAERLQTTVLVTIIWDKAFENGPSEICGRQPLKNLNSLQIF